MLIIKWHCCGFNYKRRAVERSGGGVWQEKWGAGLGEAGRRGRWMKRRKGEKDEERWGKRGGR